MKPILFLVAFSTVAIPLAVPAQETASERPIVAVFNVETKRIKLAGDMLEALADYLSSRLTETGAFQVVPRDTIKGRLKQQKQESHRQCYDQSCQIELGRELAANMTLSTRVMKLGDNCVVTLTLYDLKKAATEKAATSEGGCTEKDLLASVKSAVGKLAGTGVSTSAPPPAEKPKASEDLEKEVDTLVAQGKHDQAVADLEGRLQAEEKAGGTSQKSQVTRRALARALVLRGMRAVRAKDYRNAFRDFARARRVDPANREALLGLEHLANEARKMFNHALKLSGTQRLKARKLCQTVLEIVPPGDEYHAKCKRFLTKHPKKRRRPVRW